MRRRAGHFHITSIFGIIFLAFLVMFLYRLFTSSHLAEQVKSKLPTSTGIYRVEIIPPQGNSTVFILDGKVDLKGNYIYLTKEKKQYYYPVPEGSQVVIEKIK